MQMYEDDATDGLTDWNFTYGIGGSNFTQGFTFTSLDPFPGATDLSAGFVTYGTQATEGGRIIWSADDTEIQRTQIPLGLVSMPSRIAIGSTAYTDGRFGIPTNPVGAALAVDYIRVWEQRDICLGGDSFIYPAGSLDGRYGGQGWDSPWSVTSGSVEVEGLGDNLMIDGLTLPTPTGDRIAAASGDIAVREMATPISLFSERNYWISMLVKKDDAGDFRISFRNSGAGYVRWAFGVDATERAFAEITGATFSGTGAFPIDETVLVIAKLEVVGGAEIDAARIAIYRDGDILPSDESQINWLASDSNQSSVTMDFMDIDIYDGNVEIDEFKLGETLADVLTPTGAPSMTESFDYADATLDAKNGGAGWNDAWLTTQTGMLSNDDVSLAYPTSPSTKTLVGSGDTLVITDGTAERTIADDFGLFDDDSYFMSFLANKSASGDLLIEALDSADHSRWKVGLRGNDEIIGGIANIQSSADQSGGGGDGSLTYPASVPLTASGARIAQTAPGSAELPLSSPTYASGPSKWVSFLARKDETGAFNVNFARASDGIERWLIQVAADGTVRAGIFGVESSEPGVFPNDEDVLVISELVGDVGSDTARVVVIDQGEALPADAASIVWDAEFTTSTSVVTSKLVIDVITGTAELDEFRYGDSYEAVTSTEGDGDLSDVESFDYTGGSIDGSGDWSGDLTVAGEATESLDYPVLTPAIPFTSSGGRIDQNGAGSATLDDFYPNLVLPNGDPNTNLPITRWMSFLAQKDASGAFTVSTARETDGVSRWNVEVSANGTVRADIFGGLDSAAGLFPNDETVMVITRWTGDGRSLDPNYLDKVDVKILKAGDALPASEAELDTDPNNGWDIRYEEHTTLLMQELLINVTAGHVQIDEWRYGDTYESVTSTDTDLFLKDSFAYPTGTIAGNMTGSEVWEGDLNVIGTSVGFANETLFVLSMFEAGPTSEPETDTVYVKAFRSASELPASAAEIADWDLIVPGQSNVLISKIRVSATGGAPALLDELKIGATYASVTTFALVGDCNEDGVLDAADFLCIEPCIAGPDNGLTEGCEGADIDSDGDADIRDIALFSQSL